MTDILLYLFSYAMGFFSCFATMTVFGIFKIDEYEEEIAFLKEHNSKLIKDIQFCELECKRKEEKR